MVVGDMTILMCAYGCSVVVRPFLEFFEVLGLSEDGLVGELVVWGGSCMWLCSSRGLYSISSIVGARLGKLLQT